MANELVDNFIDISRVSDWLIVKVYVVGIIILFKLILAG